MARIAKDVGNRGAKKISIKEKYAPRIFKDLKAFLKAVNEYEGKLVTPQEASVQLEVTRACVGNWALTRGKIRCFRYQSETDKNGIMLVDWDDCVMAKKGTEEKPLNGQIEFDLEEN